MRARKRWMHTPWLSGMQVPVDRCARSYLWLAANLRCDAGYKTVHAAARSTLRFKHERT
jgi:hypothetical protein